MNAKFISLFGVTFTIVSITSSIYAPSYAIEDTSDANTHSIADSSYPPPQMENGRTSGDTGTMHKSATSDGSVQSEVGANNSHLQQQFNNTYKVANDGLGGQYYASTTDKDSCVTADHQPGQYFRTREMPDDGNDYTGYYNTSGIGTYCNPVESRTLTANNPRRAS